ncbi:type VII secretion protein EccE [Streptomyces daghestanicus]|uniref:Type VII secretion protein EccE n=1 Tax=Streptomyces daghestanicus TaxID=66885 RepID=A0ABQ3Q029_9ACTN|nr:type VII secretion protein EccE [Streptomyces daghestanicus]GGU64614.1 type VII secretion protein EccE [Streptomyces daghestanicus]GHI30630.1 type VII secretion protein EccE [Streptomyces daghestanicus]
MSTATRSRRRNGGRRTRENQRPEGPPEPAQSPPAASDRTAPAAPAAPTLARRPGSIGPIRVQQLVGFELAAAVLLIGWLLRPIGLTVGIVLAVPLVLAGLLRRRGRPLPEWFGTARALRDRRKRNSEPVPPGTDPGFAPAVECDPALRTYSFHDRQQREIGMVGDGTFLSALVQVEAADLPLRPAAGTRDIPLDLLQGLLEVDDIRLASVQVVQHTQPAPAPHLPPQAMAVRSYGPLQAQSMTPGLRLTWVALKLDPELCPEAVQARGGGMQGARRALLRVADQLASRLMGAGLKAKVLSESDINAAIATSSCVNPLATTGGAALDGSRSSRRTAETSRAWRCDDRWHTTYWISRWPQVGGGTSTLPQLVGALTSSPALASTFSLTIGKRRGGLLALSGHVRLTGRGENELDEAAQHLERSAAAFRVGLVRLDREQLPGVLATLPLGGTR